MKKRRPDTWANVKASLDRMERPGLLGVIHDLYKASSLNRRFLHARFVPAAPAIDEYRGWYERPCFPTH